MREADLPALVEAVRGPVEEFVRQSRVRVALLISSSGQVVAQHGFSRRLEVINVASLAAAANAAAGALAQVAGRPRWRQTYHAGRQKQLFIASLDVPPRPLILVAIFDQDSSLGLARLFFEMFEDTVQKLAVFRSAGVTTDAASFERDLEAGVHRVFSRPHDAADEGTGT